MLIWELSLCPNFKRLFFQDTNKANDVRERDGWASTRGVALDGHAMTWHLAFTNIFGTEDFSGLVNKNIKNNFDW